MTAGAGGVSDRRIGIRRALEGGVCVRVGAAVGVGVGVGDTQTSRIEGALAAFAVAGSPYMSSSVRSTA